MRISRVTQTGILSLSVFLGACASNDLRIERELAAVNTHLAMIDARIAHLEQRQLEHHESLSQQHQTAFSSLMETTIAEVDRLVHQRPPVPILIGSILTEQSEPGQQAADSLPAAKRRTMMGDKQVIGSIERVHLSPPGMMLEARIDTGAESSSIDARDITEFKRDGNTWVRFRIMDHDNQTTEIERRVVRHARILQSSTSEAERRPVVRLRIAIGSHAQVAEFTLTDREHLSYPILIGRNVLNDVMLVDVSRTHIAPLEGGANEDSSTR
ncbi:MAG: ATP-dependent zinc protease [Gammaproteobacteria bacterium]|nr:ATP-dependent zinc protease [Gammaproteobacteria bacterium]